MNMADKTKLGILFGGIVVTLLIQMLLGGTVEAVEEVAVNGRMEQMPNDDHDLRLRVIAHSDESFDQVVKRVAVFAVEERLNGYHGTNIRHYVQHNLVEIRESIERVLVEIDVEMEVEISFGYHYFPASSDYYESLVVRLGDAEGENWWCFINPGICTVPSNENGSINDTQVEVTAATQYSLGDRAQQLIGGWFNRNSNEVVVSVESEGIDWFLFDDEQ